MALREGGVRHGGDKIVITSTQDQLGATHVDTTL